MKPNKPGELLSSVAKWWDLKGIEKNPTNILMPFSFQWNTDFVAFSYITRL